MIKPTHRLAHEWPRRDIQAKEIRALTPAPGVKLQTLDARQLDRLLGCLA